MVDAGDAEAGRNGLGALLGDNVGRGTDWARFGARPMLKFQTGEAPALRAACEEMEGVLVRSAHSSNIKERRDASTGLFDADGQMVMQAAPVFTPKACAMLATAVPPTRCHRSA